MKGYWLNLAKISKAQKEEKKPKPKPDKLPLKANKESCSADNSCQSDGTNILPRDKSVCKVADGLTSEPTRLNPEKVDCLSGLKVKLKISDKLS